MSLYVIYLCLNLAKLVVSGSLMNNGIEPSNYVASWIFNKLPLRVRARITNNIVYCDRNCSIRTFCELFVAVCVSLNSTTSKNIST